MWLFLSSSLTDFGLLIYNSYSLLDIYNISNQFSFSCPFICDQFLMTSQYNYNLFYIKSCFFNVSELNGSSILRFTYTGMVPWRFTNFVFTVLTFFFLIIPEGLERESLVILMICLLDLLIPSRFVVAVGCFRLTVNVLWGGLSPSYV